MAALFRQFGHPRGGLGRLAGRIMARRNVAANAWAVELLHPQRGDHVLDLGCGPGVAVSMLAEACEDIHVTGADASSEMAALAKSRNLDRVASGAVTIVQAQAESLPFAPVSFTGVCAVNSLAHWSDKESGLREIARVLQPGGRVVLLMRLRNDNAGRYDRSAYGTPRTSVPDIEALLETCGFESIATGEREVDGEPTIALVASNRSLAPGVDVHITRPAEQ